MKKISINIFLLLLTLYNQKMLLQGSSTIPEKLSFKEPLQKEEITLKTKNNKKDTRAQPCPHTPITEFTPDIINLILFYDCDYIDKIDSSKKYELYPLIDKYRQAVIDYDETIPREQQSKFILRYPPSLFKEDIITRLNSIQRNLQTDTPQDQNIFVRFKKFFSPDKETDELNAKRSLIGFMKKNICLILENTFYIQQLATYLDTYSKFKGQLNGSTITLTTLLDDLTKLQKQ